MSEEFDEKRALEVVNDIRKRHYARDGISKAGWTSRQHLQNVADRVTVDDWNEVSAIIRTLTPAQRQVVEMYRKISDEFARGLRCSVCGRTSKQSKALGYDCAREC